MPKITVPCPSWRGYVQRRVEIAVDEEMWQTNSSSMRRIRNWVIVLHLRSVVEPGVPECTILAFLYSRPLICINGLYSMLPSKINLSLKHFLIAPRVFLSSTIDSQSISLKKFIKFGATLLSQQLQQWCEMHVHRSVGDLKLVVLYETKLLFKWRPRSAISFFWAQDFYYHAKDSL